MIVENRSIFKLISSYIQFLFFEVGADDLKRWLLKSKDLQWDYKNIVKRKGRLEKLK
jgi:hypothetical protein